MFFYCFCFLFSIAELLLNAQEAFDQRPQVLIPRPVKTSATSKQKRFNILISKEKAGTDEDVAFTLVMEEVDSLQDLEERFQDQLRSRELLLELSFRNLVASIISSASADGFSVPAPAEDEDEEKEGGEIIQSPTGLRSEPEQTESLAVDKVATNVALDEQLRLREDLNEINMII